MKGKEFTGYGLASTMIALLLMVAVQPATAQQSYLLSDHEITIYGTSNVHDWEEDVTEAEGTGNFTVSGDNLVAVSNVVITMPVKGIESGKSKMDDNTYEALEADEHPELVMKVKNAEVDGNEFQASVYLTIAGETKVLNLPITYQKSGNRLTFSGQMKIDMTSWGVEPPTAMFGTITTGKVLTITYTLKFTR